MSKMVWQKMGPPEFKESPITLKSHDGHPYAPLGLFQDILVELADKIVLIYIEDLDPQLDYNILLGRSYMYAI